MSCRVLLPRILAIDPVKNGAGFVVLEGQSRLVDWGLVKPVKGEVQVIVDRIVDLARRYDVDVVVFEDVSDPKSRRGKRAKAVVELATEQLLTADRVVRFVTPTDVRRTFGPRDASSKYAIAASLVDEFPELRPLLPPKRRIWESENENFAIFDAVAFGRTITPHA